MNQKDVYYYKQVVDKRREVIELKPCFVDLGNRCPTDSLATTSGQSSAESVVESVDEEVVVEKSEHSSSESVDEEVMTIRPVDRMDYCVLVEPINVSYCEYRELIENSKDEINIYRCPQPNNHPEGCREFTLRKDFIQHVEKYQYRFHCQHPNDDGTDCNRHYNQSSGIRRHMEQTHFGNE